MLSSWDDVQLGGSAVVGHNMESIRQLQDYKPIIKAFLKKQIQSLLEELCAETGEESVVITANICSGTLSSVGSQAGKGFLDNRNNLAQDFFDYCQSCSKNKSVGVKTFTTGHKRGATSQSTPPRTKKAKIGPKSACKKKSADTSVSSDSAIGSQSGMDAGDTSTQTLSANEESSNTQGSLEQTNGAEDFDFKHQVIKQEICSDSENYDTHQTHDSVAANSISKDGDGSLSGKDAESSLNGLLGLDAFGTGLDASGTPGIPMGPVRFVRKYPPKERVNLSLSEKIAIIEEYETGPIKSHRKLAEKYNISKSTVAEMLRNKTVLQNAFMINANTKRKRFNSASRYADVNALVWTWYNHARQAGIQMSGPMIQEKALQLAKELQIPGFKASNGWLHSWKSRYNITSFKDETVEATGAKPAVIRDYSKVEGEVPPGCDTESASNILSFGSPLFNFVPVPGMETINMTTESGSNPDNANVSIDYTGEIDEKEGNTNTSSEDYTAGRDINSSDMITGESDKNNAVSCSVVNIDEPPDEN